MLTQLAFDDKAAFFVDVDRGSVGLEHLEIETAQAKLLERHFGELLHGVLAVTAPTVRWIADEDMQFAAPSDPVDVAKVEIADVVPVGRDAQRDVDLAM